MIAMAPEFIILGSVAFGTLLAIAAVAALELNLE